MNKPFVYFWLTETRLRKEVCLATSKRSAHIEAGQLLTRRTARPIWNSPINMTPFKTTSIGVIGDDFSVCHLLIFCPTLIRRTMSYKNRLLFVTSFCSPRCKQVMNFIGTLYYYYYQCYCHACIICLVIIIVCTFISRMSGSGTHVV